MLKRTYRSAAIALAAAVFAGAITAGTGEVKAAGESVDIMYVSDTHSHLNSFETIFEGETVSIGGYARLATVINDQKAKNPDTLLLDGGDFSMGTLFQTIYEEEATELRMLGALGIEYTTIGNHEFDYRSNGLANMISSAVNSGDAIPQMVICNIDWDACAGVAGAQTIKEAFELYGVKPYAITERDGVKIAVIGVFGIEALSCAPTCELKFKDPIEAVKETVADIKANEDADMIVLISHSGVGEDAVTDVDGYNLVTSGKSEDELMAQQVPELDLIISGHSHTTIKEALRYGDTYVVGCGEYTEQIGSLTMTRRADGRWNLDRHELIATKDNVAADPRIQEMIDAFEDRIDEVYLSDYGYTKDQVLAVNDVEFCLVDDLYSVHEEHNLGSFISDAFVYEVEKVLGTEVTMAVAPSGTTRETFTKGNITVTDAFNTYSLGYGTDGKAGYPLIMLYLTGKDLKMATEIDATVSDFMRTARLYLSGVNFTFNPHRILLNRVEDAYISKDGQRIEIEDDKLYPVVADLYSGQMLSAVTQKSFGLLELTPRYADGTPVTDLEELIVYNPDGTEVKAWYAVADYLDSFEENEDGISVVPASYSQSEGRKVVDESRNIFTLVKNPNKYSVAIVGIAAVVLAILALIIVLIVKLVRKIVRKGRKNERSK